MRQLSIQQLCSFVDERQKFEENLVILHNESVRNLTRFSIIGCRIAILLCAGHVTILKNGHEAVIEPDDFVDILEGTRLQFLDISPDADLHVMFTTRQFIMDTMHDVAPGPQDYMIKILINPKVRLSSASAMVIKKQLESISDAMADLAHHYRPDKIRNCFRGFAIDLGNVLINESSGHVMIRNVRKRDMLMVNFMSLVWANFRDKREISFYARELCITPKHLSRVVKEVTGKSPHEIIATEVISLSIQLLQNNSLLIQQVADILHFSDQAAFSKFFRKYVGMSPVEYRRGYNE